ncbi:hypothetical protein EJ03DRAFT_1928 [Teratosphaeria nubilosa]|uniref:F-box domain-containing protein n=1 Tax=Teratosphaeria nubilosa TaxID=161662 RepID=A0A6G1LMR0_9PEZI|nr:hypothetical protein EJ03DRAFT_1928 [Teratosphaeria nubilosa]
MVYLPDELWLHILSFVPPAVIWTNCLLINRQLYRLGQTYAKDELLPRFRLSRTMSLASGSHHRWYDLWGTITFHIPTLQSCTKSCSGSASGYVLFSEYSASPVKLQERVLLKWRSMAVQSPNAKARPREWKVQFGDEDVNVRTLTTVDVLGDSDGAEIRVNWRELLSQYWGWRKG